MDRLSLRRSIPALFACALALFVAAVEPDRSRAEQICDHSQGLGTYGDGSSPPACWRPYAQDSPFNRPVQAGAPRLAGSRVMIDALLKASPVDQLVFGDGERDGGIAVYWSLPEDPVYELRCTKDWGRCEIEGERIRVPAGAIPTGGYTSASNSHDAHMTVVDQASGWEYDLWGVQSKGADGVIEFSWGGKTRVDGDGLGSDAIAARYGSLAGIIRPAELRAGTINHALLMTVPCTETHVYPATKPGMTCTEAGLDPALYPPMGARVQLALSDEEIRRLDLPQWKRAIATALARYGAYVSDTTGDATQWGFELESGESYVSLGKPDPWVELAKSYGATAEDYNGNGQAEYWMDLEPGVPWRRLRLLAPCAARDACQPVDGDVTAVASPSSTLRRAVRRRIHSFSQQLRRCLRVRRVVIRRVLSSDRHGHRALRVVARRSTARCGNYRATIRPRVQFLSRALSS